MMAKAACDRYGSASELLAALRHGQDSATRAAVESEVKAKALRFVNGSGGTLLAERISGFCSRLLGFAGFAAFSTSLFLPYLSGIISNLEWDRSLQNAKCTPVPVIAVVVGLACLSLTTACLRSRTGRGLAQLGLAWMASAALEFILEQMQSRQGNSWQTIIALRGIGAECYAGGAAALLLGSFISFRGVGAKVTALFLYAILMMLFVCRARLMPV